MSRVPGTFYVFLFCTILIFSFFFFLQVLPTTMITTTFINTSSNRSGGTGSNSRIRDSRRIASRVPGMFFFLYILHCTNGSFIFFLQVLPTATNEDHGAWDKSRSPSVSFFFSFSFLYYTNLFSFLFTGTNKVNGEPKGPRDVRCVSWASVLLQLRVKTGPKTSLGP